RNTSTTAGTISYAAKVDLVTGTNPRHVAIWDIWQNGKADLVVVNKTSNTLSYIKNTNTSIGVISFATKIDYGTGTTPFNVSIGDLDGDSKPDFVVANQTSNSVSILRNTST